MSQTVRFQEILHRLAIIDEGVVEGHAGLGLGLPASRPLGPKTAALVRVGALVAIGSPGGCLEWGTTRALAAGATAEEITDVLLAVVTRRWSGRLVGLLAFIAGPDPYERARRLGDAAINGGLDHGENRAL